ncbi:hypothetical protein [Myroides profundi]|uniref:GIY-YIG domain-containing protein n=1 Tax=Myroides profundi TaxID=480520 RepID=A0AAJ4W4G2_MYRPR|nr:hypothetical protein [Myroides profundi]AJH14547.1 hypothetical protein MPR_1365 [Myroides profundi]SEQ93054.1 hypothetical protein SAMN04488089_107144 [Myroides profundi]
MDDILNQDRLLKEIFEKIIRESRKDIIWREIGEFKVDDFGKLDNLIDECNFKGIYFFEIKNNLKFDDIEQWKQDFIDRWEERTYKRKFVPNTRKSRLNKLIENQEWIPLYIGKSRKVSTRIKEHIYKPLEKNTFAMKLAARENFNEEIFRVKVLEINVDHYDWIVPLVEKELRNIYHPIVGKQ